MRNLPDSTYAMYERFKSEMHATQERVDSLNLFNDTVFLTPVLFIEAATVSTPFCLPPLLTTANQMSRFGMAPHESRVYRRKSRVYEQYTRQDHPMGNAEKYCSIINV